MSTSNSYHRVNLAEQLELVAAEMLEAYGPSSLSLREVARRAGVSHNAPYRHFADRVSLLKALGVRGMRELVETQELAASAASTPKGRLSAIAAAYIDYAVRHPGTFAVIYDPDICEPGNPSEAMAPLIRRNEALLGAAVADFFPSLPQDEQLALVAATWGTAHGIAQLAIAGHFDESVAAAATAALLERLAPSANQAANTAG